MHPSGPSRTAREHRVPQNRREFLTLAGQAGIALPVMAPWVRDLLLDDRPNHLPIATLPPQQLAGVDTSLRWRMLGPFRLEVAWTRSPACLGARMSGTSAR